MKCMRVRHTSTVFPRFTRSVSPNTPQTKSPCQEWEFKSISFVIPCFVMLIQTSRSSEMRWKIDLHSHRLRSRYLLFRSTSPQWCERKSTSHRNSQLSYPTSKNQKILWNWFDCSTSDDKQHAFSQLLLHGHCPLCSRWICDRLLANLCSVLRPKSTVRYGHGWNLWQLSCDYPRRRSCCSSWTSIQSIAARLFSGWHVSPCSGLVVLWHQWLRFVMHFYLKVGETFFQCPWIFGNLRCVCRQYRYLVLLTNALGFLSHVSQLISPVSMCSDRVHRYWILFDIFRPTMSNSCGSDRGCDSYSSIRLSHKCIDRGLLIGASPIGISFLCHCHCLWDWKSCHFVITNYSGCSGTAFPVNQHRKADRSAWLWLWEINGRVFGLCLYDSEMRNIDALNEKVSDGQD